MNRIRLAAGHYVAKSEVTVSQFCGEQAMSYRNYPAGAEFEIPQGVNHHWHAATYHPDFGDTEPEFTRID